MMLHLLHSYHKHSQRVSVSSDAAAVLSAVREAAEPGWCAGPQEHKGRTQTHKLQYKKRWKYKIPKYKEKHKS